MVNEIFNVQFVCHSRAALALFCFPFLLLMFFRRPGLARATSLRAWWIIYIRLDLFGHVLLVGRIISYNMFYIKKKGGYLFEENMDCCKLKLSCMTGFFFNVLFDEVLILLEWINGWVRGLWTMQRFAIVEILAVCQTVDVRSVGEEKLAFNEPVHDDSLASVATRTPAVVLRLKSICLRLVERHTEDYYVGASSWAFLAE